VFVPHLSFRNPRLQAEYQRECRSTPVRPLEPIELVPVWSGALERQGAAPGLSAYIGQSSIYHSPAWGDGLKRGECLIRGKRKPGVKWGRPATKLSPETVEAFTRLLRKGVSLRSAARQVGISPWSNAARAAHDAVMAERAAR
jgi:hypothetical protein